MSSTMRRRGARDRVDFRHRGSRSTRIVKGLVAIEAEPLDTAGASDCPTEDPHALLWVVVVKDARRSSPPLAAGQAPLDPYVGIGVAHRRRSPQAPRRTRAQHAPDQPRAWAKLAQLNPPAPGNVRAPVARDVEIVDGPIEVPSDRSGTRTFKYRVEQNDVIRKVLVVIPTALIESPRTSTGPVNSRAARVAATKGRSVLEHFLAQGRVSNRLAVGYMSHDFGDF
jgi:hypothetical protein